MSEEHRRAIDSPDAPLRAKVQRMVVGTWHSVLRVLRDIAALVFAVGFAVTGVHGRLQHDDKVGGWDVALCFLAGCMIFGEHGLKLYASRGKEEHETQPG